MNKQPGDVSWSAASRSGKPWSAWWSGWPRWSWFAAVLALVLIPIGGRRWFDGHRLGRHATARVAPPSVIPSGVPRLEWQIVSAEAITSAADFALAGDTLLVLDALSRRVVLLRLEDDAWRPLLSVGRRGGGPGEFLRPRSLALVGGDAFAVLEDDGRLQYFGRDGTHLRSETPSLPCPMFSPALILAPDGRRFAAGNCAGPGPARDTVFSALFRRIDPPESSIGATLAREPAGLRTGAERAIGTWHELKRVPRMALDLSWGSTFATLHPLSRHGDLLYFGTGVDGCLTRLPIVNDSPSANPPVDECNMVAEVFRGKPPAELVASQRAARRRGDRRLELALTFPEVLPAFFAVVPAGEGLLLARPFSAESLAFVPAVHPFRSTNVRLVAPVGSLVTCTNGACLWYDAERGAMALARFDADGVLIRSGPGLRQ